MSLNAPFDAPCKAPCKAQCKVPCRAPCDADLEQHQAGVARLQPKVSRLWPYVRIQAGGALGGPRLAPEYKPMQVWVGSWNANSLEPPFTPDKLRAWLLPALPPADAEPPRRGSLDHLSTTPRTSWTASSSTPPQQQSPQPPQSPQLPQPREAECDLYVVGFQELPDAQRGGISDAVPRLGHVRLGARAAQPGSGKRHTPFHAARQQTCGLPRKGHPVTLGRKGHDQALAPSPPSPRSLSSAPSRDAAPLSALTPLRPTPVTHTLPLPSLPLPRVYSLHDSRPYRSLSPFFPVLQGDDKAGYLAALSPKPPPQAAASIHTSSALASASASASASVSVSTPAPAPASPPVSAPTAAGGERAGEPRRRPLRERSAWRSGGRESRVVEEPDGRGSDTEPARARSEESGKRRANVKPSSPSAVGTGGKQRARESEVGATLPRGYAEMATVLSEVQSPCYYKPGAHTSTSPQPMSTRVSPHQGTRRRLPTRRVLWHVPDPPVRLRPRLARAPRV